MDQGIIKRNDLIYPELSYKIVGILFDVYNSLGYGHKENSYQKATALGLRNNNLNFKEQLYIPIEYQSRIIGSNYLDFLVEDKIILEIKKGDRFSKTHIDQVYRYLINSNLQLGILAYFSPNKIHFKRIVNVF